RVFQRVHGKAVEARRRSRRCARQEARARRRSGKPSLPRCGQREKSPDRRIDRDDDRSRPRGPRRSAERGAVMLNNQGRPTGTGSGASTASPTFSGNRGLDQDEPLMFELSRKGSTGVDLPEADKSVKPRIGGLERKTGMSLPGLSEPEIVRHFVRLSQKNFGI